MSEFLFGMVVGVLVGAFVLDVNVRFPDRLKKWLASWFPKNDEPAA